MLVTECCFLSWLWLLFFFCDTSMIPEKQRVQSCQRAHVMWAADTTGRMDCGDWRVRVWYDLIKHVLLTITKAVCTSTEYCDDFTNKLYYRWWHHPPIPLRDRRSHTIIDSYLIYPRPTLSAYLIILIWAWLSVWLGETGLILAQH